MKKIFILTFPLLTLLISCGKADQETINKMAGEMCAAMELYDETKPISIIEVTSALKEIAENADEYSEITESELEDAMKTICPDGFNKYHAIMTSE